MQITRRTPFARGVDQLMYVGDDGTSAPSAAPVMIQVVTTPQLIGVGLAFLLAPKGKGVKYAGTATAGAVLWNIAAGKFAV